MQAIAKFIKPWLSFLLGIALILGVTGCSMVNIESNEPLPAIAPLPLPELPDWIEQISPTGEAEPLAQIRVIFKEPLIPVARIDTPQQKDILKKFEVLPPLPGQFRFLTPRMVGFQGDKAIPKATRVQVTLKAGLADLKGHKLEADLPWTFNTETIQLTNLPRDTEPIALKPSLNITSNVELELNSMKNQVSLIPEGKETRIAVQVELKEEDSFLKNQLPEEKFDPSQQDWTYLLTPKQTLEKATRYQLEFAPGIVPANGNLATETKFYSNVKTYSPLALEEIEPYGKPDAGGTYGRFDQGSPQLRFNNGLIAESIEGNITLKPAPKQGVKLLRAYDGDPYVSLNPWSLKPNTNYTITLGKNLQDQFGQTLDKNVTLRYKTGDIAPDIWAPTGLNIFPGGTDLQLHISTVNLPENKYQAAYRVVKPTDLVYTDAAYPQGKGKDLLPDSSQWQSFRARGKKNQVFEHKIPLGEELKSAKGMLAYGVKAKANRYQQDGQELWREPEFYGLVQLTNLGVFAQ